MSTIHNFDLVADQEPIYFDTAAQAIAHLNECGYWSAPIEFNSPKADEYFNSRYAASDWSESGSIHYKKRE
jgi:hypothetical protein